MLPKPTPIQRRWQALEWGMFCHFGINTFNNLEWSDGTLSPATFNPAALDVRQWVATAQQAGMRYMLLTAKHHDGFCLWPTATTDYSIASSPYRGGQGDIVGELAAACREAHLPLGLYLSPWDRHEPCYSDAAAYDRFYIRQLTELCTRYGQLCELWFDGAGSDGRGYDWEAIMNVVDRYQPQAVVFNMGRPTIRWVGNEDGLAGDPNYYVVAATPGSGAYTDAYLAAAARYLPPECDVSIRKGWFWHPHELPTLKSLEHLLGIYYRSVGLGANLLLNVPPNRAGLIDDADRQRLQELHAELARRFASPISGQLQPDESGIGVSFGGEVAFDHLVLCELLDDGQLVDGYSITDGDTGRSIASGATIGHTKIHAFPLLRCSGLRITGLAPGARLASVTAYRTGHEQVPGLE